MLLRISPFTERRAKRKDDGTSVALKKLAMPAMDENVRTKYMQEVQYVAREMCSEDWACGRTDEIICCRDRSSAFRDDQRYLVAK